MMYNEALNPHYAIEAEFYKNYFSVNPNGCINKGYKNTYDNETDIYVITFNNPFMVEYQIKTLKTFFKTPFNLIIVDNNSYSAEHQISSAKVFEICDREKVIYLKAPQNYYQEPGSFDSSMKLGTTMSWLFNNCIKTREPKYFGFLDHDCFLFRDFDIVPYLNLHGMYGRVSRNTKAYNLHVTTNFFRFDFVKNLPLDFRASHKYQLDTGGANYDVLYHKYDHNEFELDLITHRYAEHDVNRKDSVQHYEIIDRCWFHMAASTHDQLAGDGLFKLSYAKGFLDSKLLTETYCP